MTQSPHESGNSGEGPEQQRPEGGPPPGDASPRPPSYSRDPQYPPHGEQQDPYGGQYQGQYQGQPPGQYPGQPGRDPSGQYSPGPYAEQQPPYGNPYYGRQPPHPGGGGTNPLSIWSLVAGIVGLFTCGIIAIAAVVLGHLSLRQIAATGQRGRGMAIAGMVLGYLSLIGWVIYWILVLVAGTRHGTRY